MDGARRPARSRAAIAAALVVSALLALASCAPVADQETADATPTATAKPTTTRTAEPTPTPTVNGGSNGNGGVADGPQDPAQQTRRSGPAAEYGGPPYGDQGAEFLGDGRWCATVALFWGDAPPPINATFTIDGIQPNPAGALTGQGAVCGNAGATTSCIGFTMTAESGTVFCSMLVVATPSFANQATVTFFGTLECTEPQYCDAAIARRGGTGPPIIISSPERSTDDPPAEESPPPSEGSESP